MRVLLVEDNANIGNAVQDHLHAEGWTVHWATDLKSAIASVVAGIYDVVLLDLRLPDGSGLDVLRHVRAKMDAPPVVIMSAYDQLSDQMTGMSIGAVDYLIKPFGLAELVARVHKAVASSSAAKSRSLLPAALSKTG